MEENNPITQQWSLPIAIGVLIGILGIAGLIHGSHVTRIQTGGEAVQSLPASEHSEMHHTFRSLTNPNSGTDTSIVVDEAPLDPVS